MYNDIENFRGKSSSTKAGTTAKKTGTTATKAATKAAATTTTKAAATTTTKAAATTTTQAATTTTQAATTTTQAATTTTQAATATQAATTTTAKVSNENYCYNNGTAIVCDNTVGLQDYNLRTSSFTLNLTNNAFPSSDAQTNYCKIACSRDKKCAGFKSTYDTNNKQYSCDFYGQKLEMNTTQNQTKNETNVVSAIYNGKSKLNYLLL